MLCQHLQVNLMTVLTLDYLDLDFILSVIKTSPLCLLMVPTARRGHKRFTSHQFPPSHFSSSLFHSAHSWCGLDSLSLQQHTHSHCSWECLRSSFAKALTDCGHRFAVRIIEVENDFFGSDFKHMQLFN